MNDIDFYQLNGDRAVGEAMLIEMQSAYEKQFDKLTVSVHAIGKPLSFLKKPEIARLPADLANVKVLDDYEVKGFGYSMKEAIAAWQQDLHTKPQSGKHLVWRVTPECDWAFDFSANRPVWKVYARFAVLPSNTP